NDEKKRFFLFGPKLDVQAPKDGFKLLLVLPGGDGQADFNTFIKSIRENCVSNDFIVAQLVAPQWSAEQAERNVWPVKLNSDPQAKFTTEAFVRSVIDAVGEKHAIDPKHIYAMGWSS